jgi:hypothetical protein
MRINPRFWRIFLIGMVVTVALLGVAVIALLRTPGWYAPPAIAVEDRQRFRNNLAAAEQAMTENLLNSPGHFTYHLYQDDVNRWIAMRREIYPLIDELAPPQLADPFVLFDEDGVTLAGRYRTEPLDVVLSIDFEIRMEGPDIVLAARSIRCGSLSVPLYFEGLGLEAPIHREREKTWPGSPAMSGDLVNGLRIESTAWWKNGGMDYRVLAITLRKGQIDLEIEPLGRHAGKQKK